MFKIKLGAVVYIVVLNGFLYCTAPDFVYFVLHNLFKQKQFTS